MDKLKFLVMLILIAMILSSCKANGGQPKDVISYSPTETTNFDDNMAKSVEISNEDLKITNFIKVNDLINYLKMDMAEAIKRDELKDAVEIKLSEDLSSLKENNYGLTLSAPCNGKWYDKTVDNPNKINFIRVDLLDLNLLGITKDSSFKDIQKILGKTGTIETENLFKESKTYELRYIINDLKIKFVSADSEGNKIVALYAVNDFSESFENVYLYKEQLKNYFNMSAQELVEHTNGTSKSTKLFDDSSDKTGEKIDFLYKNQYVYITIDENCNKILNGEMEVENISIGTTFDNIIQKLGDPSRGYVEERIIDVPEKTKCRILEYDLEGIILEITDVYKEDQKSQIAYLIRVFNK